MMQAWSDYLNYLRSANYRCCALSEAYTVANPDSGSPGVGADQILHILVMRFGRIAPTTDCPSAKCPEFGFLELGEHARIDDILYGPHGQVHTIWRSKGVPEAIGYLIAAQERATPRLVGGPISILGMDKSGPHWIVPGTCSAQ